MATNRDTLERQMREAAAAGKFELAARYRDELRRWLDADAARAAGDLHRQQPGAMGLGSSAPGGRAAARLDAAEASRPDDDEPDQAAGAQSLATCRDRATTAST